MKREFLKCLGLTDEQIEQMVAENGKDVQAEVVKAQAGLRILYRSFLCRQPLAIHAGFSPYRAACRAAPTLCVM